MVALARVAGRWDAGGRLLKREMEPNWRLLETEGRRRAGLGVWMGIGPGMGHAASD